jgi:urease accessory protein
MRLRTCTFVLLGLRCLFGSIAIEVKVLRVGVDSRWHQKVTFYVSEGAKLLYSEIFCPGRVERGEFWDFDVYSSKIIIEKDKELLLNESTTFMRQDKEILNIIFGNNKYYLKAYWYSDSAINAKREIDFQNVYGGATEMANNKGLIIKALSNDLNDLKKFQLNTWKVFRKNETGVEVPELRIY